MDKHGDRRYGIGYMKPRSPTKQSVSLSYRPIVFTVSIDYQIIRLSS